MPGPKHTRIAIHHPPGIAIWEDILRGVFDFARPDLPWIICANFDRAPERLAAWEPDAVIAQCDSAATTLQLQQLNVPVVSVAREKEAATFPTVQIDDVAVGRMAADYFLNRGFTSFACYTAAGRDFMDARRQGFEEGCDAAHSFDALVTNETEMRFGITPTDPVLTDWLKSLPPSTAVFATTDALGVCVSMACREAEIPVPDSIALLAASNNELLCNLDHPPLSSIRLPGRRLGFEAARMLQQMLNGFEPKERLIRLSPVEVVGRHSSDVYCIQDEDVAAAMNFIRDRAGSRINVADVVQHVAISRSALERRFRKLLGRTMLDEILAQRVRIAKTLLVTHELSLAEVARQSGFGDARQFSNSFRKLVGETPSAFRQRISGGE
ncbi:MAG: substrate-binding domain-containing protein [Planctomycetota bacterium]